MENSMKVSQKIKSRTIYHPAILLGKYMKEMKSLSQRDTCSSMFIAELFTIAKA